MKEKIRIKKLHFHGPFGFAKGNNYLFDSAFAKSEGVYIWTIRDESKGVNYVHYIGETVSFAKRHREHLIQMTGLNYRIIDPSMAKRGVEKIVWDGMWRDKTPDAAAKLLEKYDEISKNVVEYINLIKIYFAPTKIENSLRKHIEGCLGMDLREKYPNLNIFYPKDNYVVTISNKFGEMLLIEMDEKIAGIDETILI